MKRLIFYILTFLLFQISYSQNKAIKIQYVYNNEMNLDQEIHFNRNGQIVLEKNINIEHYGCGEVPYYSKTDTAVFIYHYDSLGRKSKVFYYSVENGIAGKKELYSEYFYNDLNQLIYIRNTHPASPNEYFKYDSLGNVIKEKSDIVYIWKYDYDTTLSISTETMYEKKEILKHLCYRKKYIRDTLGKVISLFYYNYDDRLTRIIRYNYNEKGKLIFEEETQLDVYTVESQREDRVSSYSYKYNEFGYITEEYGIGQWAEPKTIIYKYEYY